MNAYRIPSHDACLLAGAESEQSPREPSDNNYSEAFDKLVADSDRLAEFCMNEQPDYTSVFQFYHRYGLPKRDGTDADNKVLDRFIETLDALLTHYRDYLGGTLQEAARAEMEREDEMARQDAAETAADGDY